jgi:hypothetical protein
MSLKFSQVQEAWDSRNEPESLRVLVAVFWRALLVVLFVVLVCACLLGFEELSAVSQAENPGDTSSAAKSSWSPAQLEATLSFFSQRQQTYQALSQSPLPTVADPSK